MERTPSDLNAPESRLHERAAAWNVSIERVLRTASSLVAFGHRESHPVVLKVATRHHDEWRAGEVLATFEGQGVVRVHEHAPGAMLMERASPGQSLVGMAVGGGDDEATGILAATIRAMTPGPPPPGVPTVGEWRRGFDRYAASADARIPATLLSMGRRLYSELDDTQHCVRLLHGDLHHDNVLFDTERGWLAIDPKGVIGEVEYEVGAALRNPERPDLFADRVVIQRRVRRFCDVLDLQAGRVLAWAFAQAVLSAVWTIEDNPATQAPLSSLRLAEALWPMVNGDPWGVRNA